MNHRQISEAVGKIGMQLAQEQTQWAIEALSQPDATEAPPPAEKPRWTGSCGHCGISWWWKPGATQRFGGVGSIKGDREVQCRFLDNLDDPDVQLDPAKMTHCLACGEPLE
jgi:hypothetical protein